MRGYARLCAHNSGKLQLSLLSQPPANAVPPSTLHNTNKPHKPRVYPLSAILSLYPSLRSARPSLSLPPPGFRAPPHTGNPAHTTKAGEERPQDAPQRAKKHIWIASTDRFVRGPPGPPAGGHRAAVLSRRCCNSPPPGRCVRLCAATAPHRDSSSLTTTHRGHLSFSAGQCARARPVASPRPFLSGQRAGA